MSTDLRGRETLDRDGFAAMLRIGVAAVADIGEAKPSDKSLVDVLVPARDAYEAAAARGESFSECLAAMDAAAESGFEATRDLVADVASTRSAGSLCCTTPA